MFPACADFTRAALALLAVVMLSGCPQEDLVTVPNVIGLPHASAERTILSAGLEIGEVSTAFSLTVRAGNVISQSPTQGREVPPGASVSFVVSAGPQQVAVPDITGRTQAEALLLLAGLGLIPGTVSQLHSPTMPAGLILSQSPAPGEIASAGTQVSFAISLGPEPRIVAVPSVIALPLEDAQQVVTTAGLTAGVITQAYHPSIPAGSIAGQSPRAGANVTPGSAVSLVVSLGPPAVVPDLVNLPQAEAEAAITAAGLTLGLVTQEHHPTIPAGHVTAQSPAVGTTVAAGTVVTLVLSLGPEPLEEVLVPDVLGLPQPDAEALILAAGLNIGTVTQLYSTTADPGTVIGQSPAAEELALEGDPVNLEVAVDVIPVESLEDLQRIGYDPAFPLDARYLLVQDIDAAETFEWNEGAGFIPIGDAAAPFTGIFDGAGHVILNLYIHRPVENFVGLFGALGSGGVECDSGRVYDLHLLSAEVTGARFVGALSGYAPAGSIQDCTVDAAVYGQKHTAPLAGYLEPTDGECSLQSPDSKL